MYELQLIELDYRGIPIDAKTVKQTSDPKKIETLERYANNFLKEATASDYDNSTFLSNLESYKIKM